MEEIERHILAQCADDVADLGQQLLCETVCALDRFFSALVGRVPRDLELETERGEVVAEAVVEVACDAEAFGGAGAVGKELAGGEELGVGAGELVARLRLASGEPGRAVREELEPA
jgi:hypothetical protein